jgi:hypothetical protein
MPLLDHFHAPLRQTHRWPSFHATWAVVLMEALNRILPPQRYLAEVKVSLGADVEADVAEFDLSPREAEGNGSSGGVAVQTWAPPVATHTIPLVLPDDIEVRVVDFRDGARLAAVIELISPANKDRPERRRAFAAKCLAYLQSGIGLISVYIVTESRANLHNETLALLDPAGGGALAPELYLYAVAYRPARREGANQLDLWTVPLAVGQALPLLPLALRGAFFVPVDLEATYTEARQRSRL